MRKKQEEKELIDAIDAIDNEQSSWGYASPSHTVTEPKNGIILDLEQKKVDLQNPFQFEESSISLHYEDGQIPMCCDHNLTLVQNHKLQSSNN